MDAPPAIDSGRILARIAHGSADDRDWLLLVQRHGQAMRRAVALAGGGATDEDAVQEAFIHLRRCAGRFRHRGGDVEDEVRRWLQGIAMNCALGLRRAAERRLRRDTEHARASLITSGRDADGDGLADALADLDQHARRILVLRHVECLDYPAIARALDITETTARKRLSRLHQRLRQRVADPSGTLSVAALCARLDGASSPALVVTPAALPPANATPILSPSIAIGGMSAMTVAAATALVFVPVLMLTLVVTARATEVASALPSNPATPGVSAGAPLVAQADHPLPLLIRQPGTYRYAFGARSVIVAPNAAGTGLTFTFTASRGGVSTSGSLGILVDPASPWLVYVESEDRIWWFDGKDELALEQTTVAGSRGLGWGVVADRLAHEAPRRLVAALPDAFAIRVIATAWTGNISDTDAINHLKRLRESLRDAADGTR